MKKEKGQVVLILILVMTVALAIGISVIQRSLSDVSTSTKVEDSSRAFSAAEAGIEKAISLNSSINVPIDLGNSSKIQDVQKNDVPAPNQALEYPPLAKEDMAQVWLADPTSSLPNCDPGKTCYSQNTLDVYWGNAGPAGAEQPAIEITIVYYTTANGYVSKKYFMDPDTTRNNGFDSDVNCPSEYIRTSLSPDTDKRFLCKKTLGDSSGSTSEHRARNGPLPSGLMLLRARLLYNSTSQAFAVRPKPPVGCSVGCDLPIQGRLFTSTGVSAQTQRKVQVFRVDKVVPTYFDYAIFSAGDINK